MVNDPQVSTLNTPSGLDVVEHMISGGSTLASSDSFTTVMGYVEGIMKIGDAIAEVSSFTAEVADEGIQLPTGPSLCESSVESVDGCTFGTRGRAV